MSASSAVAIASRRSELDPPRGVSTMPQVTRRGGSTSRASSANPIPVVPGSMPRTVPALGVLQHLEGDVEVRVHLLHVVELLETFDELQDLLRLVAVDTHAVRRAHAHLGRRDRDRRALDGLLHLL